MKTDRILCAMILLALLVSVPVGLRRVVAENQSRQVEMVADYVDFTRLAQIDGVGPEAALSSLREAGITSIGLEEVTLERLNRLGAVTIRWDHEMIDLARAGSGVNPELRRWAEGRSPRGTVFALTPDPATANWLKNSLTARFGAERVEAFELGGTLLVGAPLTEDQIKKLYLGFWEPEFRQIIKAGLRVAPRPANYHGLDGIALENSLNQIRRSGGLMSTVIFAGDQAPGYRGNLKETAAVLQKLGLVQGMVEAPVQLGFVKQLGQEVVAGEGGFRAVRVYSIPKRELDTYTGRDVIDRWTRAIKERDIRIIYIRPLTKLPDPTSTHPFEDNLEFLRSASQPLASTRFTFGPALPFGASGPSAWESWAISLGVMAGGIILLNLLLPLPRGSALGLLAAGAVAAALVFFFARGELARKALALAAALVFPSLAMVWAGWRASRFENQSLPSILARAIEVLLGAAGIAMIGALFLATLLSHNRYLLEIDYFRGVKLTLTLPLVLAAWALVRGWGLEAQGRFGTARHNLGGQIMRVMGHPLSVAHVLVFGALAAVAYIYLGRSGHTAGIEVSQAEIQFRAFLENVMVARPRIKEFLAGWPALMLAVWALVRGYRVWVIPLLIGAGVALTSMTNTFQHLRTELIISVWRSVNGVILGLILGLLAILLAETAHRYLMNREIKPQESAWH